MNVARDDGFQRRLRGVSNGTGVDPSVTFDHAHDNRLVVTLPTTVAALLLSTDPRLVNFDMAFQRPLAVRLRHQFAKLMRHAPRSFVSAADLALQFLRRHAVTGTRNQVHGEEPVGQLRAGLVEDCPGARVDVEAAHLTGVGTALGHRMELVLLPAVRAHGEGAAVVHSHKLREAGRVVRILGLELFESIFHGSTLTCREGIANL